MKLVSVSLETSSDKLSGWLMRSDVQSWNVCDGLALYFKSLSLQLPLAAPITPMLNIYTRIATEWYCEGGVHIVIIKSNF